MRNKEKGHLPKGRWPFSEGSTQKHMTERINRILKYQANRVRVYEDTLRFPDGRTACYDYVENRNGAGVLITEKNDRILVKQYRNTLDGEDLEIPAGCGETADAACQFDEVVPVKKKTALPAEAELLSGSFFFSGNRIRVLFLKEPLSAAGQEKEKNQREKQMAAAAHCAVREAAEETGMIPTELFLVSDVIAAVGLFSERTAVFLGRSPVRADAAPDPDEFIQVVRMPREQAKIAAFDGTMQDSKTILAVLAAESLGI